MKELWCSSFYHETMGCSVLYSIEDQHRGQITLINLVEAMIFFVPAVDTPLLAARSGRYAALLGLVVGLATAVGNTMAYQAISKRIDRSPHRWKKSVQLIVIINGMLVVPFAWTLACVGLGSRLATWLAK